MPAEAASVTSTRGRSHGSGGRDLRRVSTPPCDWLESIAEPDWCESSDHCDWCENAELIAIDDPADSIDANDPTLPKDATEPMLPIDSTESREAMLSTDPSDHSDQREGRRGAGRDTPPIMP